MRARAAAPPMDIPAIEPVLRAAPECAVGVLVADDGVCAIVEEELVLDVVLEDEEAVDDEDEICEDGELD